jgi:hypothetical protein
MVKLMGLVGIILVLMIGCLSKDKKAEYTPDQLFLDYAVTTNEEDSMVYILLHFRDAIGGDAVLLPAPANVQLDGKLLQPDSAKIGGYFYETFRPVTGFSGKHMITYTDTKNRVFRAEFNYQPLRLIGELPDSLDGSEIKFEFSGVSLGDQLYVVYRDTSTINEDFRKNAEPGEKFIDLLSTDFEDLHEGPVQLEFVRESTIPVKPAPPGGGQLYLSYVIRGELFFKKK